MSSNSAPRRRASAPLIVVGDFRHLNEQGKQWSDKKGRRVYKVRQLIEGAITQVKDRRGTVIDEITMVGGYYADHPGSGLHEEPEGAFRMMAKLSTATKKK